MKLFLVCNPLMVSHSSAMSMSTKITNKGSYYLSESQMQGLFKRISENNVHSAVVNNFYSLQDKGETLGLISPSFAYTIGSYSDVFKVDDHRRLVSFHSHISDGTMLEITSNVAKVTADLRQKGIISGWRNELLPVVCRFNQAPRFLLERSACSLFGVKSYGVHVNGYIRSKDGHISHMWVGRRSRNKSTWPGMLDHIVAGGQPHGIGLLDNVVKECEEEASIPAELARRARAAGAVSYLFLDPQGSVRRDALFCYDLELPEDFVPVPMDGEVDNFERKDLQWVIDTLVRNSAPNNYKPNCNLVIIDFLIRYEIA